MYRKFEALCIDHGIQRETHCQKSPSAEWAKRANRTVEKSVVSILSESGLSTAFWVKRHWPLSFTPATDPSPQHSQVLHGTKPNLSMFRVWGCTAYVLIERDKCPLWSLVGTHMEKCVFIGYPQHYKGWKFYNPVTKKVVISEKADFDECYFILQRHSFPHLPPLCPDTLLESPLAPSSLPYIFRQCSGHFTCST